MALRSGPAMNRGKIRDKRITHPWLWIDLNERSYSTILWAPNRFIMDVPGDRLGADAEFCAVGRIEDRVEALLIDGAVTMHDRKQNRMAVNFEVANPDGASIMRQIYSESREAPEELPLPSLSFSLAYKSVNWSLTGFMIGNYTGDVQQGQVFTGLIRLPKSQRTGRFRAQAVRYMPETQGLGCRFLELSQSLFDMLEYALKRSENP
jgi:hypothetical protein